MIPTQHLRWASDGVYKPPRLQQLWVGVHQEELERVHWWTPAELMELYGEDDRCEWRDIPSVILPI